MIDCAYCERPLTCDGCGADYLPGGPEAYAALSRGEQPIGCPSCGRILVCRWCKTPYDGRSADEAGEDD